MVVAEADISPSVEGRGICISIKAAGDSLVFSIAHDAFRKALCCLLHQLLDVLDLATFYRRVRSGQIHDNRGRNTEDQ